MRNPGEKIGVVLFQLGGPDSLESVEPFLYNLFRDPDIIDLPLAFLFRRPLARLISTRRAPKVQEYYKRIGGKSPIRAITDQQARALTEALRPEVDARVMVAMRYWHPFTAEAVETLARENVKRIVLLPLYPQYSIATTGSSLHEWQRVIAKRNVNHLRVDLVEEYCDHPMYISAIADLIRQTLAKVPVDSRSRVHLVFSAHGTPVKLVKRGDPYQQHVIRTYEAVLNEGNFGLEHSLCYQSKVGPEKWLEPSLDGTIERLAREGVSHVVVVPIAFVSDHVETLWEINIETREEAAALGIGYFDMTPALNTHPLFIRALADLVLKRIPV
jgi:ferrochelatase